MLIYEIINHKSCWNKSIVEQKHCRAKIHCQTKSLSKKTTVEQMHEIHDILSNKTLHPFLPVKKKKYDEVGLFEEGKTLSKPRTIKKYLESFVLIDFANHFSGFSR